MQLRFGGFFITLYWLVKLAKLARWLVITVGSLVRGEVITVGSLVIQAAQETSPASGHVEASQAAQESVCEYCTACRTRRQGAQGTSSASGLVEARAIDRVYCVWFVPDAPEACGVWVGPHPETWSAICAFLPKMLPYGAHVCVFISRARSSTGARIHPLSTPHRPPSKSVCTVQ